MIKIMKKICHFLEEGEDVVLATIVDQSGSAPRSIGTKMGIRRNGIIIGTIGGGLVEFEVQKNAREVFKTRQSVVKKIELSGVDAATTDRMICGGRLEILLEIFTADSNDLEDIEELIEAIQKRRKSFVIKTLDVDRTNISRMTQCLTTRDEIICGSFPLHDFWIPLITDPSIKGKCPIVVTVDNTRFFVEPMFVPSTVYLFGAGHVSRPVAELASMVHFNTVVLDDRVEFANVDRFPKADMIKVVPSFRQAFDGLEIDEDGYIVIVTRGHLHDKTVLEQALRTNAGYIGMIGSRRKRDLLYQELLDKNFSNNDLKRVYAPIGLDIKSETPEEIAVSIVAELIRVRAQVKQQL